MTLSTFWTVAGGVTGIFLLIGSIYVAYRNAKSQAEEKESDRTIDALQVRNAVLTDERNEARSERDLFRAERDHALDTVETLRSLADNTPRLDRIVELLESQNATLREIRERGDADT